MQRPNWIEPLLQSLVKGHQLMDPSAWAPPNPFLLDPLFEDLWLLKMKQLKDAALKKGISFQQMADAVVGPSCIRKEFRYALWGGKLRELPIGQILEIITFYKDILVSRSNSDPFALHNAYWHDKQQISDIVRNTIWQPARDEEKHVIGKISANGPALAWGLYTDFFYHRSYEVYGLYKQIAVFDDRFGTNDVLMIRQFGPFKAPELWPHSKKFPINTITILGIYRNLHCDFDYINHFTTSDNIPEKLQYYSVLADGTLINNFKKLEKINAAIIKMAITQDQYLKALDAEGQKRFTVNAKYYALKELFDLVGITWYPDDSVLRRFVNRPLLDVKFSKLDDKKRKLFWKDLFDPYHDFSNPELRRAKRELR